MTLLFLQNTKVWIILPNRIHYHGVIIEQNDTHIKLIDRNNKEVIILKNEIIKCEEE